VKRNAGELTWQLGVTIFGLVRFLSKKVTKPKIVLFLKNNQNRIELIKNRSFSVQFGFYD
jgi:hypothetical protein